MTKRIRGVLAPVVTPFRADLSPDRDRFIAHCEWLLARDCGLAAFGTNSEANSLSFDERAMLLETDPETYSKPAYLHHAGWISIDLSGEHVDWEHVADRIAASWELAAPRRLLEAGGR